MRILICLCCLLLAAACISTGFAADDSTTGASAPLPLATTATGASASATAAGTATGATPAADPGAVVLSNDLVEADVQIQRGALRALLLRDAKTLPRHSWQHDGVAAVPEGLPVPVLGSFHPAGASAHNWIQFHDQGIGDPNEWTLTTASATSVTLTARDGDGLEYTIVEHLAADRPTLITTLTVHNPATAAATLPVVLYPLNGVHQDDPTVDLRYLSVFRHFGGTGGKLKAYTVPANRMKLDIPVDSLDYLGLNSRFFIAFWKPIASDAPVAPVAATASSAAVTGPGGVSGPTDVAANPAAINGIRSAAAIGFFGDQSPEPAHQCFLQVVYEPLVIAPGASTSRSWAITITSVAKTDLARLDDSEREAQFTDSYYWFFKSLAQILTIFLGFLHAVVGSYGWSVVIMTILIKLALHHFTYKSQSSMLRMQQLAPEIALLKNQYGSDSAALGQAQLKLYAKHGINPLGGCLPALVQIPVFGALLMTFSHSADLRGQPFLWVADLTQPDQLLYAGFNLPWFGALTLNPMPVIYILANLGIAFMTKPPQSLNPDDPNAQMMQYMRWMPTVIGVFFYQFPSGLVLYYTLNSVLTFCELRVIKWRLGIPH